jgi:hypothetical protein
VEFWFYFFMLDGFVFEKNPLVFPGHSLRGQVFDLGVRVKNYPTTFS